MIILAFLLILAAVAMALLMLIYGHPGSAVLMTLPGGFSWSPSPLALYLMGVLTVLSLWAGMALLKSTTRRRMNRRREVKRLKQEATATPTRMPGTD